MRKSISAGDNCAVKTIALHPAIRRLIFLALALGVAPAALPQVTEPRDTTTLRTTAGAGGACLPGERGFLRASLRGAVEADLDWRGAPLQCEGGARPDGQGLRVSFLGPVDASGHRLRIVFGIAALPGAARSTAVATNVTVIVEGEQRVYATRGDGRCAIDAVVQEALPPSTAENPAAGERDYRIAARGSCIDPATTLDGSGRLYINRFDFAGIAHFEDNDLHAALHD